MRHDTLLEAQLSAFPDSIVLEVDKMYDALASSEPEWLQGHEFKDWERYEARHEMGWWSERYYYEWKDARIEQARAQWARNALLYKSQYPEGFFYACCRQADGTYKYVGFRYGLDVSEYASGFYDMTYTPVGAS